MSIIVENITKLYGQQKALDSVSFTISPGHIVGLLGPNGAGKTTMMKILTCFIPPTSGEVKINDFDLFDDSLQIRKIVGYLPEHNPLYTDMYVREYLEFVGGIHKVSNLHARVDEMIGLTGLGVERKKKISALSKGYKQRVGIAQALIHDPEILILDEPTSGLDPNQLVEIRNLITTIGKEKTVILSTHVMQEVEAICNRAIIINKGKIVADDSTENLQMLKLNDEVLLVEFDKPVVENKILAIPGVVKIKKSSEGNTWLISTSGQRDVRQDLFQMAVAEKLTVLSLQKKEQSLEQIFQELTKNK